MICNKMVLWKFSLWSHSVTCDSLLSLAGMYFLLSSECAISCWCTAEGRQSPSHCLLQGRNQSICLQEMHVLLFFFSTMFVSSPCTIYTHKQSASTNVSTLDQPQNIWLSPRDAKVLYVLITTTSEFCCTNISQMPLKRTFYSTYHLYVY